MDLVKNEERGIFEKILIPLCFVLTLQSIIPKRPIAVGDEGH